MICVYISILDDCISSEITYENLIKVTNKINNQHKNTFNITVLNLYDPNDAIVADKLNIFDAPCITCKNKHLQGLVTENIIYKFLKQFINYD